MYTKRGKHLFIVGVLLALALLAACTPAPTPAPTAAPPTAAPKPTAAPAVAPTSAPVATAAPKPTEALQPTTAPTVAPTTASAQPVRGGIAVIATDSDPDQLNPGLTTSYNIGDIGSKIFSALVWLDPNWAPQPQLAESWTISSDAKVYTFKLRSGVIWHDGKPFTSADVKYSFDEILLKLHPRTKGLAPRIKSIETPDAQTVVFTLNDPYAPFMLGLTVFDAPILPKHLYDGQGDVTKNPANLKPIGTGPFKFSEWNKGSTIKLVRNESYFEKGLPYLDGLVYQIIPQATNRATALETGEVDYVVDFYFPKTDVKRLESSGKFIAKHGQGAPAIEFMMFNTRTKALATKEARQAIAMVIDRKRMVDQAMNGIARIGFGPFGDGFKWLMNPDVGYDKLYPLNVAKAKSMLDAAGVTAGADGSRGTLRLLIDAARGPHVTAAQIIKENLKDIGFNVDVQALERSVMIQKAFLDWDYDLTLQSFVSSGDPAIGYHRLYVTTTTKAQFTNQTGYTNPAVDDLFTKAATTPNQADRAVFYKNAQTILAADLPSIVLFDDEGVDFASKKLNGLFASIESRDRFDLVWLSK